MKIRVVPCGKIDKQTDGYTDRRTVKQTEMTKLIVEFRNFSIAPKMKTVYFSYRPWISAK